ncbi:MAG: ABC transporter permease subunit [SAR324 cluster bacterium]|nr:ABC transporter permease subunit [SAR324 cluster bacterium]
MRDGIFIQIDITDWLNRLIDKLVVNYGDSLREVSAVLLRFLLVPLESFLLWLHPGVVLLATAIIAWYGFRSIKMVIICLALMYLIGAFGLWEKYMQTLSIMTVSIAITILIGIPMGIVLARVGWLGKIFRPILDGMQTFPMFVYMLPAVMLFSIGKVPAVMATVIYSLPPLVRLTELGIVQVDREIKEAATSFGASKWQLLRWVFLPLARPSIMAGINQTTMMALAMVVVASMIGARGLGEDILYGITNLDFGRGVKAGISIVIIAFIIDRITQAYGVTARIREMKREIPNIEEG